ncbi:MAG TPA: hypothetical protein ENN99_04500, partial [Chloroflexi bacterium]|nr:hypothetical protein [Chloroflexota bacterium]
MADLYQQYPIDALNLPARARNALVRAGIITPEKLATRSEDDLLAIRSFGATSLSHVREALAAWESEHAAASLDMPDTEEIPQPQDAPVAFLLLPGRRVLHAAWLPGSSPHLFLWGEEKPISQSSQPGESPPPPPDSAAYHPFHLLPTLLHDSLPGLIPPAAEETQVLFRLPAIGPSPQSSPQLIRDFLADVENEPESLGTWRVAGFALSPLDALAFLNDLPQPEDLAPRVALGADLRFWSLAGKLALEILARQQFAPTLIEQDGEFHAQWVPVLDRPDDLRRVEQLAEAMPTVCRAVIEHTDKEGLTPSPAPRILLKDFLGKMVDSAVRAWAPPLLRVVTRRDTSTLRSWLNALFTRDGSGAENRLPGDTKVEQFHAQVSRWQEHLLAGAEETFRICFRLEPPTPPEAGEDEASLWIPADEWALRFFLQARDDPSLLIPASLVWREQSSTLRYLDRRFDHPQEKLLAGLGHAAVLFPPLADSLRTTRPQASYLDTEQAYTFLREAAPLLEQSGFGVLVPSWWKKRHKRLGVQATLSPADGSGILNLDSLVRFRWQLALGDQILPPEEFNRLAALKLPLVQVRGEWVELQPEQIEAAIRFWEKQTVQEEEITLRQALQVGLSEEGQVEDIPITGVETQGWISDLLRRLNGGEPLTELEQPHDLAGQLRPYQLRGFSWLVFLRRWGLGACLADDMGLGKTIQTIALILHDLETGQINGPVLVICPTSVVGNWAREIGRFAPALRVVIHHGSDRASGDEFFDLTDRVHVVISTYALARRDEEMLREVEWAGVVLDEAQNIKNPAAKQTQAIRRLASGYRIALTGTPVENRLSELWSIMQFLNPGYLGSQQAFSTRFARPIERYQDQEAATRLRKLVHPFILRRVKSDPTIIQDLPDKLENKVYCTLTPEQATLYQAVVEDAMRQVEEAEGIQRRGLVLSMLMRLKQICNHPAQFLGDGSALLDRSGKLSRLGEMLEEVQSVDERALVFTQFAEMGALLQTYLQELFGGEVLFLYGGTPANQRDRMITRFQEEQHGPAIFVLSLKAGGLGLNLTRANHVFHFDRWWNPAVENQATDRAFRIGQTKDVWVHKFVCAGTLEERIDELIESKKALAESVIGAG